VGGEFQGAVFRFSGGIKGPAHRIIEGPDGALYVGVIGADDHWGGWSWGTTASRRFGLHRMNETGAPFFDVLAVRSMGTNTFEIEFTEPLVSASTSNFLTPQQWAYIPVQAYGSGKQTTENLTLQSVSLSPDKKKVTLTIPGLKRSNAVYLRWTGLTSESGRPLMTDRAWYTLNEFGPGEPVAVAPALARRNSLRQARALPGGHIALDVAGEGVNARIAIRDARGALLETLDAPKGAGRHVSKRAYTPGVYLVTAGSGDARASFRVTVF
jgi:hypothetical protein